MVTDNELKSLKAMAEAATPGPWHYNPDTADDDWELYNDEFVFIKQDDSGVPIPRADGEFIAAANPFMVLRLIKEIDRLKDELSVLWESKQ